MSFLYSRVARAPLRTSFSATTLSRPVRSPLSTSSSRAALNESDRAPADTISRADTVAHGKDLEDVAEHIERKKQEQQQEQKEGRGQWKQELGTNSEQAVKADRGEVEASKDTISKMQKETAESAEAEKK